MQKVENATLTDSFYLKIMKQSSFILIYICVIVSVCNSLCMYVCNLQADLSEVQFQKIVTNSDAWLKIKASDLENVPPYISLYSQSLVLEMLSRMGNRCMTSYTLYLSAACSFLHAKQSFPSGLQYQALSIGSSKLTKELGLVIWFSVHIPGQTSILEMFLLHRAMAVAYTCCLRMYFG